MFKKILENKKISRIAFFLFLFSVPLGTKKFIFSFTGGTSEFDAVFIFLDDALFFISVFFMSIAFFGGIRNAYGNFISFLKEEKRIFFSVLVFLFFSLFSLLFSSQLPVGLYFFLRLTISLAQCLFLFFVLRKNIISVTFLSYTFIFSAVFQAVIGFLQFLSQKSVGVWFLGESIIDEFSVNVARFPVFGAPLLRAYGTMAHANILAGFLVLGVIACLFLWINKEQKKIRTFGDFLKNRLFFRAVISICLFVIFVGIILTFSRSGWIVSLWATILSLCVGIFYPRTRRQTIHLGITVCILFAILFMSLGWMIFPRATLSRNEPSVNYRVLYNNIGRDIVFQKPLGVGMGNQIFFSKESGLYEKYGIYKNIDRQPIHNLYLLIMSELGIFGIISFLYIIAVATLFSFKKKFFVFLKSPPPHFWFGAVLLSSLLVFGLFDHFLWTLGSGRLMLWLVLGIMMWASREPSS